MSDQGWAWGRLGIRPSKPGFRRSVGHNGESVRGGSVVSMAEKRGGSALDRTPSKIRSDDYVEAGSFEIIG